jgi:AraC-like DNA-binding protein
VNACVFVGPTLPVAEARQILDADYLPPVRQGDVYRAVTRLRPLAVGIIDGYFHQVPSVWHKEILWAMAEGVHVFGSSSMGALRAAELQTFGMRGVGEVFAAFRDQRIEDDDEVAVIHGPRETGFLAASEAMVNIRRTLDNAQSDEIVSTPTRDVLENIAKSLLYPRRTYEELVSRGAADGLPANELSALSTWLEHGRVDLKRQDALEMLGDMRDLLAEDPAPKQVEYAFEHTTLWEAATATIDATGGEPAVDGDRSMQDWLLDELRLDGHAYDDLIQASLLRLLARREAERRLVEVEHDELKQRATDFRLEHGLHFGRDLEQWLAERDLDRQTFEKLLENEVLLKKICDDVRGGIERYVIDQLRLNGGYARLAARARAKRRSLLAAEADVQGDADTIEALRALAWYFRERIGTELPDDVDAYAARLGFESAAAFRRAVVREFRFQLAGDEAYSK